MTPDGRTPVVVVTGFLGSGKTTLVNRLVSSVSQSLVVVNEFGFLGGSIGRAAAVAEILSEVKRAGTLSGLFSLSGDDLPHWRELGATFFLLSGDVSFLGEHAEAERTRVLELLGQRK